MGFRVHDDREGNVDVAPQVDFVGIGDVVDDEIARVEGCFFVPVVVGLACADRLRSQKGQRSQEECNALFHGCNSGAKVLMNFSFDRT